MGSSVARAESSKPVKTLDDVQTRQLRHGEVSQARSIAVTEVVKDALQRHYGKLETAARELGMDPGQLSRELKSGDFKLEKLERADADAKAFIADAMHEAYGSADPKAHARRILRDVRRQLDELAEVVA